MCDFDGGTEPQIVKHRRPQIMNDASLPFDRRGEVTCFARARRLANAGWSPSRCIIHDIVMFTCGQTAAQFVMELACDAGSLRFTFEEQVA
jgi:hypothetical protein